MSVENPNLVQSVYQDQRLCSRREMPRTEMQSCFVGEFCYSFMGGVRDMGGVWEFTLFMYRNQSSEEWPMFIIKHESTPKPCIVNNHGNPRARVIINMSALQPRACAWMLARSCKLRGISGNINRRRLLWDAMPGHPEIRRPREKHDLSPRNRCSLQSETRRK